MLDSAFKKVALGLGIVAISAALMIPDNYSGESFTPYYGKSY